MNGSEFVKRKNVITRESCVIFNHFRCNCFPFFLFVTKITYTIRLPVVSGCSIRHDIAERHDCASCLQIFLMFRELSVSCCTVAIRGALKCRVFVPPCKYEEEDPVAELGTIARQRITNKEASKW